MESLLGIIGFIIIIGIIATPILFFAGRSPMPDALAHACEGAPCDCSIPCSCSVMPNGEIDYCNRHWADMQYGKPE